MYACSEHWDILLNSTFHEWSLKYFIKDVYLIFAAIIFYFFLFCLDFKYFFLFAKKFRFVALGIKILNFFFFFKNQINFSYMWCEWLDERISWSCDLCGVILLLTKLCCYLPCIFFVSLLIDFFFIDCIFYTLLLLYVCCKPFLLIFYSIYPLFVKWTIDIDKN